MNWYIALKFAQIWEMDTDYQIDPEISQMVIHLNKLHYIRDMMSQRPFGGHPSRKEKILEQVDDSAYELIKELKHILQGTFEKWLSGHAITDPVEWGMARTKDPGYDFEEWIENVGAEGCIQSVVGEMVRYQYGNSIPDAFTYNPSLYENEWGKVLRDQILPHLDEYPAFADAFSGHVSEEKEFYKQELYNDGLENYNNNWGTEYATEEEAEQAIDDQDIIDVIDNITNQGLKELEEMLYQSGHLQDVLAELYTKLVFPLWYGHWSSQGIDETRAQVEKINAQLEEIDEYDITKSLEIIQLALQTAHVNGDMTDYIDSYGGADSTGIKETLTQLTGKDNPHIETWNEELRQVGVQI